jgi:hypothetical protein
MIKLFENYGIDTDERNFVLIEEKGKDKNGKDLRDVLGYYGSLKEALNGLMQKVQRRKLQEKVYTLDEAILLFDIIERDFEKLLSQIKENVTV